MGNSVNCLGFTQKLSSGIDIETVQPKEVVSPAENGRTLVIHARMKNLQTIQECEV